MKQCPFFGAGTQVLEPNGEAAVCNTAEVGSIPTGTSFKQGPLMLFVQRRAGHPAGFGCVRSVNGI